MLKKVSKLTVLFCMLVFAGSAFAQNEVPEYPQYGFWSNWSIGPMIVVHTFVSATIIPHGSVSATKALMRIRLAIKAMV